MNDFPWLKSYPEGVRWDADLPIAPVQNLLDAASLKWPEKTALEFMGTRLTYRELDHAASVAAAGLQRLGVGPGVHVGLYLPNSPHYPVAFFAILRAGGTVVNYSPLDVERVLAHKIEDSETDFIVTLDQAGLYPQMARLLGTSRLKKLIVGSLADFSADSDAVRQQLERSGQVCRVPRDDTHVAFSELITGAGDYVHHEIEDLREAVAVLQYTGGTTGLPKGAMLTHANLSAACGQHLESTRGVVEEGGERLLVVLPLFHIYSLTVNLLFGIRLGAHLVLHTRFDVDSVMADLEAKRVSIFAGVPTMFTAIVNHPRAGEVDMRSLKFCGSGGAPLPTEVGQRFEQLAGCKLNEGWGMTETSPTGTFTPVRGMRKVGSCGLPLPGIRLVFWSLDEPGSEAPLGQPGEMCISGPNVMKGYWKNPEATAANMTHDGYFRTGDVAYMDDDGFVFIVDRTKDMLLCGGFNVYPRVLEEAMYEHPAVEEVCVIGVHDDYRGQSPKAFVKLKAEAKAFTLAELQSFLKDRLGKHEMVQALEIRSELPKTAVGKLAKKELYEEEERKLAEKAKARP
jgi:long-chain acyl-CoA synthetase